ncbi:hypothetical protein V1477_012053 [Vespula maculifrons]|uniref:Uncharacterized protein n=1 Tax=Vespula maculifrons TaxID=7453 RepID=A0ABD2C127_VESMC
MRIRDGPLNLLAAVYSMTFSISKYIVLFLAISVPLTLFDDVAINNLPLIILHISYFLYFNIMVFDDIRNSRCIFVVIRFISNKEIIIPKLWEKFKEP